MESLAATLQQMRQRITKHRGDKSFNEQNTKASLIEPVLRALGWDPNDPDEVFREYKPKPRYNPVDYALMIQRTPCLFVEAKALRDPLTDDKLAMQIVGYGSVAGVEWIVLTNGDEYQIYNVSAAVPIEEKLFRKLSVLHDPESEVILTLSLLSKSDLQDKKIERLWTSSFVDRQVEAALRDLMNPEDPKKPLVRALRSIIGDKIKDSEIRASLMRARFHLDFPVEASPIAEASAPRNQGKTRTKAGSKKVPASEPASGVTISHLIAEGLIRPPAELFCVYKKNRLSARIEQDGQINLGGQRFTSPSAAGGVARKPYHKGAFKGAYPSTNGWTFWKITDPETGQDVDLDVLRRRLDEVRKAQAKRFRLAER